MQNTADGSSASISSEPAFSVCDEFFVCVCGSMSGYHFSDIDEAVEFLFDCTDDVFGFFIRSDALPVDKRVGDEGMEHREECFFLVSEESDGLFALGSEETFDASNAHGGDADSGESEGNELGDG